MNYYLYVLNTRFFIFLGVIKNTVNTTPVVSNIVDNVGSNVVDVVTSRIMIQQQHQSPSQIHHQKQQTPHSQGKNVHANQQLLLLFPNKVNVTSISTTNHNAATVVHTKIVSFLCYSSDFVFFDNIVSVSAACYRFNANRSKFERYGGFSCTNAFIN